MQSTYQVAIDFKGHANQDSLPLRWGHSFGRDRSITLKAFAVQQDRISKDGLHVDGQFELDGFTFKGHFVIDKRQYGGDFYLVTCWPGDIKSVQDEQQLNSYIKAMRKRQQIDVQYIKEVLNPLYAAGNLRDSSDLVNHFADKRSSTDMAMIKAEYENQEKAHAKRIAEAEKRAETAEKRAETAEKETERVRQVAEERQAKIETQEEMIARFQKESAERLERDQRAALAGEDKQLGKANVSFVATGEFRGVREDDPRYDYYLIHDGNKLISKKLKRDTFDRDGSVKRRAKLIPEGTRVGLTCWDALDNPGYWAARDFCRDVIVLGG